LQKAKWNLQNAVNIFFDEGAVPEKPDIKSTTKIDALFNELSSTYQFNIAPSEKNNGTRYMNEDQFSEFNQRYLKFADDNVVLGYILMNIMKV
jgi:hypothetical protein